MCCSTCNLVFHPNKCGLPLHRVPSGDWSCWFCLLDGVIPSTPEVKKAAEKVVGLINKMKASALMRGAPPLSRQSQQTVETFASLVQEADENEATIIMQHLSAFNVMTKLESAMDRLAINQASESAMEEKELKHNGPPKIPWKSCTQPYPLDENAYNYRSRFHYKTKIIKALTSHGTFEQQRLVLHHVLVDPKVINLASSIGTNIEEARVHRNIVGNMQRYLKHAKLYSRGRITDNKRAALNVICAAAVGTPPRPTRPTPTTRSTTSQSKGRKNSRSLLGVLGVPYRCAAIDRASTTRKNALRRQTKAGYMWTKMQLEPSIPIHYSMTSNIGWLTIARYATIQAKTHLCGKRTGRDY